MLQKLKKWSLFLKLVPILVEIWSLKVPFLKLKMVPKSFFLCGLVLKALTPQYLLLHEINIVKKKFLNLFMNLWFYSIIRSARGASN